MATTVLRVDSAVAEVQAVGIASRRERRPAEPVAADAKQCTVALGASGVAEARGRAASLFLEATQLKTVRTATVVLRVDSAAVEVQAAGIVPRRERRPAEPVVADAKQCTVALGASGVAEARGRAASLFLEATQRKTVRTVIEALWADTAVVEVQAAGIASRRERRPDVPVVTDVI